MRKRPTLDLMHHWQIARRQTNRTFHRTGDVVCYCAVLYLAAACGIEHIRDGSRYTAAYTSDHRVPGPQIVG